MRYPIAIEPGNDTTAFGVIVPDLPGCFSAGDTMDEAIEGAREAAALWLDAAHEAGLSAPAPSTMESVCRSSDYKGWMFGAITLKSAA